MKLKGIFAGAALLLLVGGGAANASAIVVDGKANDWGFTNGPAGGYVTTDKFNISATGTTGSGVTYFEEAGVGPLGYLGPGYGGAPFDIKGLYFAYDAANYYFAAVVGMGPTGTLSGGVRYVMGDFLITDASNKKFGIVTNGTDRAPNPAFAAGTFGAVTTANRNDAGYDSSNPVFVHGFLGPVVTPFRYAQLLDSKGCKIPDLWFIEASVARNLFTTPITHLHLTESCGNDVADLTLPRIPVPEPGTLLLFGSGLLGLAVHGRRRFRG